MKRKRAQHSAHSRKKSKASAEKVHSASVSHPVLGRYYDHVLPLRIYLLRQLPDSSSKRKKLIESYGKKVEPGRVSSSPPDFEVAQLLDGALVGYAKVKRETENKCRTTAFKHFSQKISTSTAQSSLGHDGVAQSEIVDFVLWLLFTKVYSTCQRPPHMLCHGTLRTSSTWQSDGEKLRSSIPGLVTRFPNEHLSKVKEPAWWRLLQLLGKDGEKIMINLLLDCGIFIPTGLANGSYYQLSGTLLSELPLKSEDKGSSPIEVPGNHSREITKSASSSVSRKPSQIRFVRNRMLYSRPSLNAKGVVALGMRHIHVFNRYTDSTKPEDTVHVMKYMFPRQFRLHNVFTSQTDARQTSQPFHDYTLREQEIDYSAKRRRPYKSGNGFAFELPKRLRGQAFQLTRRMQKNHQTCSYKSLLDHYCPRPDTASKTSYEEYSEQLSSTEVESPCFSGLENTHVQVSAFCRATIARVFPKAFFGDKSSAATNRDILLKQVDAFVKARRFESFTLEQVLHGFKTSVLDWLDCGQSSKKDNMPLTESQKRKEITSELVYYIFDSFLIPLIRSNFYVTESSKDRNRLFYFRHDVWKKFTEPTLNELKLSTFEEIGTEKASKTLASRRSLGYSQIRLLPKEKGLRPIINLKKKKQIIQNGKKVLGKSINSMLAPVFAVLNHEKARNPAQLGSSLFSVNGLFEKLRSFRANLEQSGQSHKKLYFAKVDVKSCFDSIPQRKVFNLMRRLMSSEDYRIQRHAEIKAAGSRGSLSGSRLSRKFLSHAHIGDIETIQDFLEQNGKEKHAQTIFVDNVVPQSVSKRLASELLNEHIENNLVKIGKKYYRQKEGIAQGSVLSSLICNFFYGDLEKQMLNFTSAYDSVLFRLVDDFLLITTKKESALRFLELMHTGIPSFGVAVKHEKSLTNFDAKIHGRSVNNILDNSMFPYCGVLINPRNLELSKAFVHTENEQKIEDSLTVEYSTTPGHSFQRKILSLLKVQIHTMFVDASYNTAKTILRSLHHMLVDVARKALHYMKILPLDRRPTAKILMGTIRLCSELLVGMLRSKRNTLKSPAYVCIVEGDRGERMIKNATAEAFIAILAPKQAMKRPALKLVVDWLHDWTRARLN